MIINYLQTSAFTITHFQRTYAPIGIYKSIGISLTITFILKKTPNLLIVSMYFFL